MTLCIPDYEQLDIHRLMLLDTIRVSKYCKAIKKYVNKDMKVIDFGSGTGIFSLVAAKNKAKIVYSIERESIIEVAKKLSKLNNLEDKIVHVKKYTDIQEDNNSFDMIVSEWMGIHALQENMLPELIEIRNKFLKIGGTVIPSQINIMITPIRSYGTGAKNILRWIKPYFDLDFEEIFTLSLNDTYLLKIEPEQMTHFGEIASIIDLNTISKYKKHEFKARFEFLKRDRVNAIAGWFKALLTKDIAIDTSPFSKPMHWQQIMYPLFPQLDLLKGDVLNVTIIIEPAGNYSHFTWTVFIEGKESETYQHFSTKNNYTLPKQEVCY